MNRAIYVLLLAFVLYMTFRNIRLFKRYQHNKDYIVCYQGMMKEEAGNYDHILDFIANEKDEEYKNKGRILKLYYELQNESWRETLNELDLGTLYTSKGKIDYEKINLNSDSTLWMIILLARGAKFGNAEFVEQFYGKITENEEILNNRLEYQLIRSTHDIVTNKEGRDTSFLTNLLKGEYEYVYDKQLIGMYKRFATCLVFKEGLELGEYERADLPKFAKTAIGSCLLKNLGIHEEALKLEEEEETEEETEETPLEKTEE